MRFRTRKRLEDIARCEIGLIFRKITANGFQPVEGETTKTSADTRRFQED